MGEEDKQTDGGSVDISLVLQRLAAEYTDLKVSHLAQSVLIGQLNEKIAAFEGSAPTKSGAGKA